MIRRGELTSVALAVVAAGSLLFATPRIASAQDPAKPAPPAQEDLFQFKGGTPALVLFQIHADKAADFEASWAQIKEAFAKVQDADHKAFGETFLNSLFKLDQPAMDTPAGKASVYILQIDKPSATLSYNLGKVIYEILWKNGAEGAPLKREEADALFGKLQPVFQSITPWKLAKVG